ncbi:MAG: aldo/keto reductase, partial [Chthonomonas sp.]|nr:aldo/keto reductase [Chthonomonas sp.]
VMGKAHYWGTSEWSAERINEAIDYAEKHGLHAPQMEQPQYSLFERRKFESEIGPTLKSQRYGTTTWSPLASGILSGKYDDGIPAGSRLESEEWLRAGLTDERLSKVRELKSFADELGCSRSQLAIAWCAKNPLVTTVITGASKLEQLHENLGALEVMAKLDEGVMAKLDRLFPA